MANGDFERYRLQITICLDINFNYEVQPCIDEYSCRLKRTSGGSTISPNTDMGWVYVGCYIESPPFWHEYVKLSDPDMLDKLIKLCQRVERQAADRVRTGLPVVYPDPDNMWVK